MAKIGLNAKLYRGAYNATTPAATDEVFNVKDLTMSDEFNEADITTRGSEFELIVPTMRKLTLEWQMVSDNADADYGAIQAAYTGKTGIALKCLSAEDGSGIIGNFEITKFTQSQALKDAQLTDVSAVPMGQLEWIDAVES